MKVKWYTRKLTAIFLIFLFLFSAAACKSDNDGSGEYERKLAALTYRKQVLNEELANLDYELGICACMSFVFTELDEGIYNDVLPILHTDKHNIVGVLAFSENELPDSPGKITREQYDELIALGWGTALFFNGEGTLREYLESMTFLLEERELGFPKSIIFEKEKYLSEYDTVLTEYGIENAIHSGEERLPIVESQMPDGVWHPGFIGWRTYNTSTKLKASIETVGGYALFRIDFNTSNDGVATSFYPIPGESEASGNRVDVFKRMINSFKSSIDNGKITVDNVDDVRSIYLEHVTDRINKETYAANRRAEINAELSSIEKQITDLYSEYYGKGGQ